MQLTSAVNKLFQSKWNIYLILIISFGIYTNTLFHDFVLDDIVVFTENAYVQEGIKGIDDIMTNDTYAGYFKDSGRKSTVSGGRYRPLTLCFFAIEKQIVGNNAMIAHLLNILFYCLLNIILYKTLYKLLSFKYPEQAKPIAFIASILFAVHPIHTEVVANIKGLDEIWSLLFSMLAFLFLLKNVQLNKMSNYILAGFFFLLALFSKENSVMFLLLIPLGMYMFIPDQKKLAMRAFIPLMCSSVVYFACRFAVIGTEVLSPTKNFLENPFLVFRGDRLVEINPAEKYGTIFYTLLKYIQLHIFPYPLTHDYAPKSIDTYSLFSLLPLLALLIYGTLIYLAFKFFKSKPIYSWSIFVFIIALLPTSNLFFSIGAYMGERYAFISSLGFCLALSGLIFHYMPARPKLVTPFLLILLLAFSARTIARNTVWKNNQTLFSKDYFHSTKSAKLNSSLGFTLLENYRKLDDKENNKHYLTQAIFHLKKAVEIYPKYADCYFLLGNAYYLNKDFKNAAIIYEKYIELNPSDNTVLGNYQKALREYGRILFFEENNNLGAKNVLLKSLKLNPNDDKALEILGAAEAELGYLINSRNLLLKSIEINPNSASAWANLYITYTRLDDKAKAQIAINKGMEIDADVVKKLMSVRVKGL
jgi:tetratricopeptide (TPR) repeat protein